MADKDRDLFLLDLSSFSSQNQNQPSSISIPLPNESDPSISSPTIKDKQIPSATRPLQVYSRRKEPLVQLMQVLDSKPNFGTEYVEVTPNSKDNTK